MNDNSPSNWSDSLVLWTAGMLLVITTVAVSEVLAMYDKSPSNWSDSLVWWTAGMLLVIITVAVCEAFLWLTFLP